MYIHYILYNVYSIIVLNGTIIILNIILYIDTLHGSTQCISSTSRRCSASPVPPNNNNINLLIAPQSLISFTVPSTSDIIKLLLKVNSSSALDPIPIKLLHAIADDIAQPLCDIFSSSLNHGIVPPIYKHAIITPTLKKSNLDPNILKNFLPISNLSFFSKTLEHIVAKQLTNYLIVNNISHPFQSAYTPKKSTETALTKISNDLLSKLDNKHGSILALLDLSAAFDTINHNILISRLQDIGISVTALKC